jgi:hypothetical protein
VILLRLQRDNPEWNASMLPYWESLPSIGGSITKENMPTHALHLLQDPVLAGVSSDSVGSPMTCPSSWCSTAVDMNTDYCTASARIC